MRLEGRMFPQSGGGSPVRHLLLIAESKEESAMIDKWLGDCARDGDSRGVLRVAGSVQLADGWADHYIRLERA